MSVSAVDSSDKTYIIRIVQIYVRICNRDSSVVELLCLFRDIILIAQCLRAKTGGGAV